MFTVLLYCNCYSNIVSVPLYFTFHEVPGYPSWYNIMYEDDDAIYTFELLTDWREGNLKVVVV